MASRTSGEIESLPSSEVVQAARLRRIDLSQELADLLDYERNGAHRAVVPENFPLLAALQPLLLETVHDRAQRVEAGLNDPKPNLDWAISRGLIHLIEPGIYPELARLPETEILNLRFDAALNRAEARRARLDRFNAMLRDSKLIDMGFRTQKPKEDLEWYRRTLGALAASAESAAFSIVVGLSVHGERDEKIQVDDR